MTYGFKQKGKFLQQPGTSNAQGKIGIGGMWDPQSRENTPNRSSSTALAAPRIPAVPAAPQREPGSAPGNSTHGATLGTAQLISVLCCH